MVTFSPLKLSKKKSPVELIPRLYKAAQRLYARGSLGCAALPYGLRLPWVTGH